jgi:ribosomal protein S18 acetylase RimI-like enzyme
MEAARPATAADIPALAALAEAAADELAPTRGGAVFLAREAAPPGPDRFVAALRDDDVLVVAGTVDDELIGYGSVRIETLRDGSRLGVIDDLFVLAGARGIGVGEAMVELLIEFCRRRDCAGVDAVALPGNRATKNFFETFGMVARAIVVHRSLRPATPDPEAPPT